VPSGLLDASVGGIADVVDTMLTDGAGLAIVRVVILLVGFVS
jgi:hypothetical protein